MLAADSIAVANNRLRWTSNDIPALDLVGSKAFTVLGNITMGGIHIDDASLPDPWRPLNVIA